MALSKKDAKKAVAILETHTSKATLLDMCEGLMDSGIKNKSFRKSIKRIYKALEQPKKAAVKKAA